MWLKIIQVMREFGLPLTAIKQVKEILFFDLFDIIEKKGLNQYIKVLREQTGYSKKQLDAQVRMIEEGLKQKKLLSEEQKIYHSALGGAIGRMFLGNDQMSISIRKIGDEFEAGMLSYKSLEEVSQYSFDILSQPHFQIPLRSLLEDFFKEPKNEKIAESFGLISKNEKKVIEALRNNEYKELTIKFDNDRKDLKIEGIKDGDIRDQKAREIMKILGLNEYSEVTLKLRNDKHIYFKNKTRLV
jgi:hypothetical protein